MVYSMDNKHDTLIIIALPLQGLPTGGYIRAYNVLMHLDNILQEHGFKVELYTPPSIILSILLPKGSDEAYKMLNIITNNLKPFLKRYDTFNSLFDYIINYIINQYEKYKRFSSYKILQKIITYPFLYLYKMKRIEENIVRKYSSIIKGHVAAIYSMHENMSPLISAKYFSLSTKAPILIMLQLNPYIEVRLKKEIIYSPKYLGTWLFSTSTKKIYADLAKSKILRLIMAVSPAPLLETPSLVDIIRRNNIYTYIPKPSNAYDSELINQRNAHKDPCLVTYFGRLTLFKGLYDILKIWKIIENNISCARFQIIGKFDSYIYKYNFFNLIKRLKLRNIKYLGYISHGPRLYQAVSKASILLYPSYQDSFSLTVLEAIALGLVVVAYDIPALRYIYSGLPNVFLVPPGNVRELASRVISLLKRGDLSDLVNNEKVAKFLELYGSWRHVAEAEARAILHVLKRYNRG